jgi:hypothetical protein
MQIRRECGHLKEFNVVKVLEGEPIPEVSLEFCKRKVIVEEELVGLNRVVYIRSAPTVPGHAYVIQKPPKSMGAAKLEVRYRDFVYSIWEGVREHHAAYELLNLLAGAYFDLNGIPDRVDIRSVRFSEDDFALHPVSGMLVSTKARAMSIGVRARVSAAGYAFFSTEAEQISFLIRAKKLTLIRLRTDDPCSKSLAVIARGEQCKLRRSHVGIVRCPTPSHNESVARLVDSIEEARVAIREWVG